jgi:hypothetical protein
MYSGKGVEKNYDLMIQHFQKSSQQNDPIGNYQLGLCSTFHYLFSFRLHEGYWCQERFKKENRIFFKI